MSVVTEGGSPARCDAGLGVPPPKPDIVSYTAQFAADCLHGGHSPHWLNNGGLSSESIPLAQLGAMFWAWRVGRASGQLLGAIRDEWAFFLICYWIVVVSKAN